MIEVIPGIYQIQLPLASFVTSFTNVYIVKGDEGCLMVDTGWDNEAAFQALESQMKELGLGLSDIRQLVVTHCHTDHYSMALTLQQRFKTRLYAHQQDIDVIKTRAEHGDNFRTETDRLLRENGMPDAELAVMPPALPEVELAEPDVVLQGGETISAGAFSLRVVWTPGHSPGHVCLYEPKEKLLFSGDLILPTIASNIGLHLQYSSNPLGEYLSSLNTVKELDVKTVLPAHEYTFGNLRQRIKELTTHHERKDREVIKIIADGAPRSAYQVSIAMSSRNGSRQGWEKLPPWDRRFAVVETLAHLQFLKARGKADRFVAEGIAYYRAL